MPKTKVKKAVCAECGVDVRKNTMFCYNCGSPVGKTAPKKEPEFNGITPEADAETQAALDDLAARFKIDEEADDKLAKAAAERKKARVSQRRSKEFTWEPVDESSGGLIIILAVIITIVVGLIVFLAVFWK